MAAQSQEIRVWEVVKNTWTFGRNTASVAVSSTNDRFREPSIKMVDPPALPALPQLLGNSVSRARSAGNSTTGYAYGEKKWFEME